MNCRSFAILVDLYLEGRLTPGRRAEMDLHSEACRACRALGTAEENEETIKAPAWFKENLAKALKTATENMGTEQLIPAAADEGGKWVFAAAGVYTCLLLVLFWSSPEIPNQSLAPLVAFAGDLR